MANVRPLKAGTGAGATQVAAADTITVNGVDRISGGALAVGAATATSIDLGVITQPSVTNSTALGSTSRAFSSLFLWDGVHGRSLADATALACGAELIGVNKADFIHITPASNNLYSTLISIDAAISGLSPGADVIKRFVRVATTISGTLATAFANGQTIDGQVLVTGDRILLKNQAMAVDNGIYTVNNAGAPTRATDFDQNAEVADGAVVCAQQGTANAGSAFVLTTVAPTIGATGLTFSALSPFPGFGTSSTTVCVGDDARLSDARTPTAHAASHKSGGSDSIKLNELAAPTADVTLNSHKLVFVLDPTGPQHAATAIYADQPNSRASSSTTVTLLSSDIGGCIKLSNAGAITLTTANLSGSLRSGAAIRVFIILTGGGSLAIADGGGCTHSGTPGALSTWLWTDDGVTYYIR